VRLIHCADIHLGSKLDSKFPKALSDKRKEEVRNSFRRMIEYAKENDVSVIMLSGDVFDSDAPFKKDKDFFFSVVENNPDIDFLYLRGNHDALGERRELLNLKLFSEEWTAYEYGNVVISGVETVKENAQSIYSTLSLNENKCNIVMLHGQEGETSGYEKVNLIKLRDKHIDYLALGHVHEYRTGKLDERGTYAQSGCLEGRGFDETGEKGFILVEADKTVTHKFIPFSQSQIIKVSLNIEDKTDAYAISELARQRISFSREYIYRLELVGETDALVDELATDVERYLSGATAFISVKDNTQKRIDIHAFDGDASIRGEFVRCVYNSGYTEEEKMQILSYGLRALDGREVE